MCNCVASVQSRGHQGTEPGRAGPSRAEQGAKGIPRPQPSAPPRAAAADCEKVAELCSM